MGPSGGGGRAKCIECVCTVLSSVFGLDSGWCWNRFGTFF